MAFEYKSNIRAKLTPNEEQLLESIDDFLFPLGQYKNLGELHQRLQENGGVLLDNKQNPVNDPFEVTPEERKTILTQLEVEIKSKSWAISRLHDRWEEVHMKNDCIGVQQVNSEMQSICNDKRGLVETKKRFSCAKTQRNGNYKVDTCHYVYGEYRPIPDQVLLYYDWIRSEKELAVVYVHEMMHAYLRHIWNIKCADGEMNKGNGELPVGQIPSVAGLIGWRIIKEIEEPIVESATLKFFEAFGNQKLFEFAKDYVRSKQFTIGITYYGFGYYVCQKLDAIGCLEKYKIIKPSLLQSWLKVQKYMQFWEKGVYPRNQEEDCYYALLDILSEGERIDAKAVFNRLNDLKAKGLLPIISNKSDESRFGDYLSTRPAINKSRSNYINSLKQSDFLDLLAKHQVDDLYSCNDMNNLIKVLEELLSKPLTPKASAAINYGSGACRSALCYFFKHLFEINGVII